MRCQNCRWFDPEHKSLANIQDAGYCRKHKPIVHKKADGRYYGSWPLVDKNDFCGEFRADEES